MDLLRDEDKIRTDPAYRRKIVLNSCASIGAEAS
jgi:hypothetical protein